MNDPIQLAPTGHPLKGPALDGQASPSSPILAPLPQTRYLTPPFSPQDLKGTSSTAGPFYESTQAELTHDARALGDGAAQYQGLGLSHTATQSSAKSTGTGQHQSSLNRHRQELMGQNVSGFMPDELRSMAPAGPLSPPAESYIEDTPEGQSTPTKHRPKARSDVDWTAMPSSLQNPDSSGAGARHHQISASVQVESMAPYLDNHPFPAVPPHPASRKRATYQPGVPTSASSSALSGSHASMLSHSSSATNLSPEYVLHPAIEAYRQAHPRRGIVYFGPYILLQTLGEGEFGKVKLGVHKDYGEEVAVKLIRRGSVNDQARLAKVEREIEVLKTVKHPNIVRLFDVIETEKYIGIILDFANGGELFDHILAHRYLKERDASKLFAQLISGVDYLHQKKIVHRDLKLENLLLDKHRNVIITDFGFANRFEHKKDDLMATSCGSPCYAAPELVISEGLYVGSAVDIWSCGVILYAMLSGYLPFDDDPANPDGDNINLLYRYIVNTPLTFPDWISPQARDLLRKMLVPDPLKRCDMETIMNHPWLSLYTPLFQRSVPELEAIAQEQQHHKRSASRKEMQARMRLYEEKRVRELARQAGQISDSVSATHQARHRSALPTMSTVPINLSASAASLPPSAFVPTSAPASRTQHTTVTPGAEAVGDLSAASLSSVQRSLPTTPAPGTASPAPNFIVGQSQSVNEPVTSQEASLWKKNRHTVQLEYDSEGNYRNILNAKIQKPETSPAAGPSSEVESPQVEEVLAEHEQSPAQVDITKHKQDMMQVESVSTDPPSDSFTSHTEETRPEPSPLASAAVARAEVPESTRTSPPREENGKRNISATSIRSEAEQTGAKRFAPVLPADKPLPPVASRHRKGKGLSMDRFGLAKLLAGPNLSTESVAAKQSAQLKRSESARVKDQRRQPTKATSVNKENTPEPVRVPAPATQPVSVRREGASQEKRPPSVVIQSDRILTPRPNDRSPSNPSITTFEAYSAPNSAASTSKAKKVMDWFRRKSSATRPVEPIRRDSQRSDVSASGFPGGTGVMVPSPSALRVEGSPTADAQSKIATAAGVPIVAVTEAPVESAPAQDESKTVNAGSSPIIAPVAMVPLAKEALARPLSTAGQPSVSQETLSQQPASVKRNNTQPIGKPIDQSLRPETQASTLDSRLRVHNGVVDQNALTAKPIPVIMKDLQRVLFEMGIETKRETEFKLRCTRVRRKKAAATTGLGISSVISGGSLASLSLSNNAATSVTDRRGLPVQNSPSGLLSGSGTGLRGILMRRGSSQTGISNLLSSPELASSAGQGSPATQPEPIYGDHSEDSGDEVRFSVELTRLKNLPGLYSLDIKRLRGNVWSYKFVYETIIRRLELSH